MTMVTRKAAEAPSVQQVQLKTQAGDKSALRGKSYDQQVQMLTPGDGTEPASDTPSDAPKGNQPDAPTSAVDANGWSSQYKTKNKKGQEQLAGARALLAYMSGRVLGQFDPFFDAEGAYGRLLLVAPNVLHVERELEPVLLRLVAAEDQDGAC